jgi:SpoIIAA-like
VDIGTNSRSVQKVPMAVFEPALYGPSTCRARSSTAAIDVHERVKCSLHRGKIEVGKNTIQRLGDIVTVKLFDRMIDRQTRELSRMLQESIAAAGGRIRLLLSIDTQMPARSPETLFESLHFLRLHADQIERIAIIGSKAWERTSIGLFGLFGGIDIGYFDRSEAVAAIRWLQGKGANGDR